MTEGDVMVFVASSTMNPSGRPSTTMPDGAGSESWLPSSGSGMSVAATAIRTTTAAAAMAASDLCMDAPSHGVGPHRGYENYGVGVDHVHIGYVSQGHVPVERRVAHVHRLPVNLHGDEMVLRLTEGI